MTGDKQKRRQVIITAIVLGALALAFYISAFFREWS